jgi:hypothetical protein
MSFDQRGYKRIKCLDDCKIGLPCGEWPWPCIEEAKRELEENPEMEKIQIVESLNIWMTLPKGK